MKKDPSLNKIHILAFATGVLLVGVFFWSTLGTLAFVGPTANPPTGNGAVSSDASNNVYIGGNLNVTGTISSAGGLSGATISAGNVSNGQFGSNVFGGNYSFPASLGIGTTTLSGELTVDGVNGSGITIYSGPSEVNFSETTQNYISGIGGGTPAGSIFTSDDNSSIGAVLGIAQGNNYGLGVYGVGDVTAGTTSTAAAWGFGGDAVSEAAAGTVGAVFGGFAEAGNDGAGTVTTMGGLAIDDLGNNNGGAVTSNYGILINTMDSGNSNFALWTNQPSGANSYSYYGSGNAKSYFGGNIGVGTTTPSYPLTVVGTSSASSYCINGANCITAWPGGGSGANPTASVGTSAINGSAGTFMRSDGAPAINQAATFAFSALGNTTSTANISASTILASSSITNKGVTSALVLNSGAGLEGAYGGASACANSGLVSAISATGATTCVTSSTQFTNLGMGAAQTASTITAPTTIGKCASTTVTITGATSSTGAVFVAPLTYPGNGFTWQGYVTSLSTVVVEECAATTTTGTATKFNAVYIF